MVGAGPGPPTFSAYVFITAACRAIRAGVAMRGIVRTTPSSPDPRPMHSGPRSPRTALFRAFARFGAGLACALACVGAAWAGAPQEGPQHIPSPDWRDQVLYLLMIDRFANGDRANDDQHAGEFDPRDGAKWSGGDLRGVRDHIPYIKALGASGVWITPPVANQWWSPRAHYGGYHGYWATDFAAVDAHFGTLDDYRALSRALHGAGMYLVQDVVVNHTANFFGYDPAAYDPADPSKGLAFVRDTQGHTAPTQSPFDRNDPRDPVQRREAIYHWTPDIRDFADDTQRLDWQLAGLDDLDTENPEVRRALRTS